MPRIRSIHPRASQDEDVASMTMPARLLWAYLPCNADREGRLEDRPLMLKGEVFPADNLSVSDLLDEMVSRGFILRYQSDDGRKLIQIVSFHDYQRPDHRERESVLPPPNGWTQDKRGQWVVKCTNGDNCPGTCSESQGRTTDCPGKVPSCSTSDSIGTGRDRSGNPVIRLSGYPEEDLSLARDPSTREPRKPNGFELVLKFGNLRREILNLQSPPGTEGPKDHKGLAQTFAEQLTEDEAKDVDSTMRLFFTHVKAGDEGWNYPKNSTDPNVAFGSWKAGFVALREELHGCAPNARAGPKSARQRGGSIPETWEPE